VVLVTCTREQQLARVMERDGSSRAVAEAMVDSQMPLAQKLAKAGTVFTNVGSLAELRAQVQAWCYTRLGPAARLPAP
jgi:dephospho-CoA kinase